MLAAEVTALARREGERIVLASPFPALHRGAPRAGTVVREGDAIGELEVLGRLTRVLAPAGAYGAVLQGGHARLARRAVGYGEALVTLDPTALGAAASASARAETTAASGSLVFRAPMAGRFYTKPSPDADPFVASGAIVETGHTLGLLEVMKSFNRVQYGGATLPARASATRVVPSDGDDVGEGDVLLELDVA